MEIHLGRYIISKRTEYSKARIFDTTSNEYVDYQFNEITEKIIDDYNKQLEDPHRYFKINGNTLMGVNSTEIRSIDNLFIPDGIIQIAKKAFFEEMFTRIQLPDTILNIEAFAFANCRNLQEIYIPDSVNYIGSYAFSECFNLTHIKLPNNINSLSEMTFFGCHNLKNIVLPDSIKLIDRYVFSDCYNLTNIYLPQNLIIIRDNVFENCRRLEKINLPETIIEIGSGCFIGCENLKEIIIPDNITSLCGRTFLRCKSLETIKLSNNMTTLPDELFMGCTNLKNIMFSDNVEVIGESAFADTIISNINIPKKFDHINKFPFKNSNVKSLTFNYDLKKFNSVVLDLVSASNINKLIINSKVKIINPQAFKNNGNKITEIDYLGTKKQFEKFRENNKDLFSLLTNLKEINYNEKEVNAYKQMKSDDLMK